MTPVILLAFANDKRDSGSGYLRGLTAERNAIRDALMKAQENGLCEVLVEPDATIERLFDIFQNSAYRDRIALFHYGGHAESYSLLLETATGEQSTAHSEGLVSFLAKQKSLKLVFLNGCSSQKQSEDLIEAGLPAVIGTSQVINDDIATSLASRFYKGLSQGLAIDPSWTDAIDQIKTETGTENTANLFSGSVLGKPGKDQFPWNLYYGEGAAVSKAWNLPEAANQPLFGLELPKSYFRKLPVDPYVGLRSFKTDEAAIFHGRGTDIRRLYTQLQREQPVVLLSGKKGVGKSSMLAAGLAPRLGEDEVISMCSIRDKNLKDSLSDALNQARAVNDLETLAPKDKSTLQEKISEIKKQIPAVSGFAKDILTYELDRLVQQAAMEQMSYYEQWMDIEKQMNRPLVVLLDELPADQKEWTSLLEVMTSIFEADNPPKGKLVVSVDQQHHSSFSELLLTANIPAADVFLKPLTKDDLEEAILGVTTSPLTKDFYRLEIEDNNINSLPTTLSGDLLEGDTTLVAPYLQVILSSLWMDAKKEDAQHPSISVNAYQQGILSGQLMDNFLSTQLAKIEETQPKIVQSGLALDLLSLHTSAMSKSKILEEPKRLEIYGKRSDVLDTLANKCCALFLLTKVHAGATNLGHNLLAPSLIRNFSTSLYPGQQASRILKGKMSEVIEKGSNVWLNEAELDVVEAGIQGMRQLTEEEEELLAFSRKKKIQAEKDRKRNRIIRAVLGSVVIVFAALAALAAYRSDQNYTKSRAGEIASAARDQKNDDNTLALRLAVTAYELLGEKSPPIVMETLTGIFFTQEKRPFYTSNYQHKERVNTAVFSPIDDRILTASEDGFVILWDTEGKELQRFSHVLEVNEAVFSPNGKQILSKTDFQIFLWNLEGGEPVDTDSIPEADLLANFSTDGMKITPRFEDQLDSLTMSSIDTLKKDNFLVQLSPNKKLIIAYKLNGGPCSLFDNTGMAIKDSFLVNVNAVSFSKDSKSFLTIVPEPGDPEDYSRKSYKSNITIWSNTGDAIRSFRCRGANVNAVLSNDGEKVLTASSDFTAKLWDFSDLFVHRFPKQTSAYNTIDYDDIGNKYVTASEDYSAKIWDESAEIIDSLFHDGGVNSAYFSPDGNHIITASDDYITQLWNPKDKIRSIKLIHEDKVNSAIFSHDGQQVLTASSDNKACLWDLNGELQHTFTHADKVEEVKFSSSDTLILSRSREKVMLWNASGDSLHMFHHPKKTYSISISQDEKFILTTCDDSLVRKWSSNGELIDSFRHFNKPKIALFSDDGKYIITAGKVVKIWDKNGVLQDSLLHYNYILSLTLSPDHKQILATDLQNAYLWDFNGRKLATYVGHTDQIKKGIFTADGKHILTASYDGYVLRWLTPQAIYERLEKRSFYKLTAEQLEEFEVN